MESLSDSSTVCTYHAEQPLHDLFGKEWKPDYKAFPFLEAYEKYKDNHNCDDWFKNIKVTKFIERSSELGPIYNFVFFGKLENKYDVVFKVNIGEPYPTSASAKFEYEQKIYQMIMNVLLVNKITPNIIGYIGSITCNKNILAKYGNNSKIIEKFNNIVEISRVDKINKSCMTILAMQGLKSPVLFIKYGLDKNLTKLNVKSVIFQILHTILVFNEIKFMHMDFHIGNILIEKDTSNTNFDGYIKYVFKNGKHVNVHTKNNLVKVYDFDQSMTELLNKSKFVKDNINNYDVPKVCTNDYDKSKYGYVSNCKSYKKEKDLTTFMTNINYLIYYLERNQDPMDRDYNFDHRDMNPIFIETIGEFYSIYRDYSINLEEILGNKFFDGLNMDFELKTTNKIMDTYGLSSIKHVPVTPKTIPIDKPKTDEPSQPDKPKEGNIREARKHLDKLEEVSVQSGGYYYYKYLKYKNKYENLKIY